MNDLPLTAGAAWGDVSQPQAASNLPEYTVSELSDALARSGLEPCGSGGYSRFVTEMIELVINFSYVRVLAKKRGGAKPGQIAPVSSGDLRTHGLAYRLYSVIFPIVRTLSLLDNLLPVRTNNAVIVRARKPNRP